ncbi:MAG: DUF2004 domain-containing protein [Rhizobiaceae bacterium]|nr:DUF2004 domain-containing protein [Rhizobiaceae bacterium]
MTSDLIAQRTEIAQAKINNSYGKEEAEFSVTLFVDHHLEELSSDDWNAATGKPNPTPEQILKSLVLASCWSSDDSQNIDMFDFSLPGDITDYLISIQFNQANEIIAMDMES